MNNKQQRLERTKQLVREFSALNIENLNQPKKTTVRELRRSMTLEQRKALRALRKMDKSIPAIRKIKAEQEWTHPDLGTPRYNEFYTGRRWRELRYLALRNANGACQACGARASDGVRLHVDHIKPRSRNEKLEYSLDNLQVLCEDCNIGKGSWDETNWLEHWKSI